MATGANEYALTDPFETVNSLLRRYLVYRQYFPVVALSTSMKLSGKFFEVLL